MSKIILKEQLKLLKGQSCSRVFVNEEYSSRRFALGFGELITNSYTKSPVKFHGEWDMGSYHTNWRVIVNGVIVAGSRDLVDDIAELEEKLTFLLGKKIVGIDNTSSFDVRVELEGDVFVDYMWSSSCVDTVFIMFMPDRSSVSFELNEGWVYNEAC